MENEIKEDIRKNSDNKLNTTSTFSDSKTLIKNASQPLIPSKIKLYIS